MAAFNTRQTTKMTQTFIAHFYPEGFADSQTVTVLLDASGWLSFQAFDKKYRCPFNRVTVSDRLGRSPRFLTLPELGRLETRDNDFVDRALRHFGHQGERTLWLPKLERAPLWILGLLIVVVVTGWATYRHGIPAMARVTAPLVPDKVRELAGNEALGWMERGWLTPSQLSEERQQALRRAVDRHFGDQLTGLNVRVLFYNSEVFGANAFALPDGTLVFTDQFVELVNETEFLAVAAHEIGHVRHDHGIRGIISSSALVAATLLITGDSEALSEIIVTAPYALAQLSYSRDMEREADTAAMELMQAAGLDRQAFASALQKMMDSHGANEEGSRAWEEYLSSHPATDERIKRFE